MTRPSEPPPMRHCCFSGCHMVTCWRCSGQFCVRFQMHVCASSEPVDDTAQNASYEAGT